MSGLSIYNLTGKWTTQNETAISLAALRGQPVVAAMAYTSCKDICPAIVADMVWIEGKSPAAVKFVFFSLDSAVDSPARLRDYAQARGLDMERWTLCRGDVNAVRELAAAIGVRYKRDAGGNFDHSSIITVLNGEGEIVMQKIGSEGSRQDLVAKLEELARK